MDWLAPHMIMGFALVIVTLAILAFAMLAGTDEEGERETWRSSRGS